MREIHSPNTSMGSSMQMLPKCKLLGILRRRKWQPTPAFLPGESQGRGSLVGCSPWVARVRHDLVTQPPTATSQYSCVCVYVMCLPTHPSKSFAFLKKENSESVSGRTAGSQIGIPGKSENRQQPSLTYVLAGAVLLSQCSMFLLLFSVVGTSSGETGGHTWQ